MRKDTKKALYGSNEEIEEYIHGLSMSSREKLEYVRKNSVEDLLRERGLEYALVKELDIRSDGLTRALMKKDRELRMDEVVMIMRDCLVEVGMMKIAGSLWLGQGGGFYVPVTNTDVLGAVYRSLLPFGVTSRLAKSVNEYAVLALEDVSAKVCKDVVHFKNCFYRFGRGSFRELKSGICLYGVDWKYRRNTKCPMFDAFLIKVLPDAKDRMCVQEFFACAYIDRHGEYSIEKFLLMIGGGANGKSVLLNIISAVIGAPYISHLDPSQLRDYKQIYTMDGKRMNIAADVRASAILSSAMKTLVSGEKVEAWKMFAGNKTVMCPPMVFSMNELPRTEDKSNGMIRRMLPVFFGVTIPEEEQDRQLAKRIIDNELSGVFDWLMEGRARLLSNGCTFTQSTKSMTLSTDIVRKSVPILDILEKEGMRREPRFVGQNPRYMRAKEIVEMFDLSLSTSPAKIARDLRDAGFNSKIKDGCTNFMIYTDESN